MQFSTLEEELQITKEADKVQDVIKHWIFEEPFKCEWRGKVPALI